MAKNILITLLIFSSACNRSSLNQGNFLNDTTEILTTILLSENFVKEIPNEIDTVYFLKSTKYYNQSWPQKVNNLTIEYIDDTSANRITSIPGSEIFDNRFRYSIAFFNIDNDSCSIYFYQHNGRIDFKYKLLKKENKWTIQSEELGIE